MFNYMDVNYKTLGLCLVLILIKLYNFFFLGGGCKHLWNIEHFLFTFRLFDSFFFTSIASWATSGMHCWWTRETSPFINSRVLLWISWPGLPWFYKMEWSTWIQMNGCKYTCLRGFSLILSGHSIGHGYIQYITQRKHEKRSSIIILWWKLYTFLFIYSSSIH